MTHDEVLDRVVRMHLCGSVDPEAESYAELNSSEKQRLEQWVEDEIDAICGVVPNWYQVDRSDVHISDRLYLTLRLRTRRGMPREEREDLVERHQRLFCSDMHPLLRICCSEPAACAERIRHYLTWQKPLMYYVSRDTLAAVFEFTPYSRHIYLERADGFWWQQSESASGHDGGGYWNTLIAFSPAERTPPDTLRSVDRIADMRLPQNAGCWREGDDHLFILEPFGLTGCFEVGRCRRRGSMWPEEPETVDCLGSVRPMPRLL